jgi:hemerythrin-like domain-containing protein
MCPIDVPYAYVQQFTASQQYIFTENFSKPDKNIKAEQAEAFILYLTQHFKNMNDKLYPILIEQLELMSSEDMAQLKLQLQPNQNEAIAAVLKNVNAVFLAEFSPLERNFFKALVTFLQNHLDLIVALEEEAILLPKEEEAYILKTIEENKANTAQRLQGWANVAKLFA